MLAYTEASLTFQSEVPILQLHGGRLVCETSISRISAPCMMFGPQLWQGSHGKRQGCRRFVALMMCFNCLIWRKHFLEGVELPLRGSMKINENTEASMIWNPKNAAQNLFLVWKDASKHFDARLIGNRKWSRFLMTFQLALGLVGLPVLARRAWSEGVIVLENRTLS